MIKKSIGLAGVVLLAVLAWMLWRQSIRPPFISPAQSAAILDDIMGVDFVFRSPMPDPGSLKLAYIHAAAQGRGLYLLDLAALTREAIGVPNEVTHINGWSPDGRYLAFVQTAADAPDERVPEGNEAVREAWVTLHDRTDGSVRRLTDHRGVIESHFFWLTSTTYLLTSRRLTNTFAEMFLGEIGRADLAKVSNYMPEFVVMNPTRAAYAYKSKNLFELEIQPLPRSARWGWDDSARMVRQLSQFAPEDFDAIRWLRYQAETGLFLFCARPTSSTWRYLFQFDPATGELTQLNHEDTYNGQWLQGGAGFAYVGNTNNSFFLAVRPQDPAGHTNLFQHGSVVNYQVAPDGVHLYATASVGVEPQGLWEYTVTNRALRRVVDGVSVPFTAARIIEPLEFRVKSFDGLDVPCFWFKPVPTETPATRYPVVIFLPPRTGQFQRSFDARAQLLANLGFHFVAVNYRGCDGYGRAYASRGNSAEAAQDILAVYEQLVRDPLVDRRNVFLSTSSDGSAVAYELLATVPERWRGAALENPAAPMFEGRFLPGRLPAIFFATGDLDRAWPDLQRFHAWGQSHGVQIQSVVYTNAGHISYKSAERKDKLRQVSQFFLNHLK